MGLNLSGWRPHRWKGTGGLWGNLSAHRPVGGSLRGAGPQGPAQKPGRPDSRVLMRQGGAFSAHSGARGQGVCKANEPHLSVKRLANHVNSLCRGGGAKPLKCKAAALSSPRQRLPLSSARGTWGHAPAVCTFVCICTCVHGQECASLCV